MDGEIKGNADSSRPKIKKRLTAMHGAAIKLAKTKLVVMALECFDCFNRATAIALHPSGCPGFRLSLFQRDRRLSKMAVASRAVSKEVNQSFAAPRILCDDGRFGKTSIANDAGAPRRRSRRAEIFGHLVGGELRRRSVIEFRFIFGGAHG